MLPGEKVDTGIRGEEPLGGLKYEPEKLFVQAGALVLAETYGFPMEWISQWIELTYDVALRLLMKDNLELEDYLLENYPTVKQVMDGGMIAKALEAIEKKDTSLTKEALESLSKLEP